jgi:glycosyltransferase involved in cell wall biosynthesis
MGTRDMQKIKKSLIVIPAYNEEKNIARVIKDIKINSPSVEILVVNDGSGDATSIIAKASGAMVIDLAFNMGYGVALQTAYKYAVLEGYHYVVQLDGDGQHDAKYINVLLEELKKEETDVVIGSRFLMGKVYKASLSRRAGMMLFNSITSIIIGQKVTDCTSGYQGIGRSVLKFFTKDIYPCDYPDADVLIMLHFAGFRIKEVPVVMFPNKDGKSIHEGLKPVYYIFKMFLSIFVTLLRERSSKKGEDRCL